MRAVRLLEHALTKKPETVLDVGVGKGMHAFSFLANGCRVTGLDVRPPFIDHPMYDHVNDPIETAKLEKAERRDDGDLKFSPRKFDMVWCCHTLEHLPNVQMALIKMREWLNDDGFLAIAVPTDRQNRLHVGHLTLWTPAHLAYNLVCAGWDCKEAEWYTEYLTIGMLLQKRPDIDMSWRTGMPSETQALNQYMPVPIRHNNGSWWANNWPDDGREFDPRPIDPPSVTIGNEITNLAPANYMRFGPNPKLRKPSGLQTDSNKVRKA